MRRERASDHSYSVPGRNRPGVLGHAAVGAGEAELLPPSSGSTHVETRLGLSFRALPVKGGEHTKLDIAIKPCCEVATREARWCFDKPT